MFSTSSSLLPLVSEGGGLVCETLGKADVLSDHFDSKQSWEAVNLPLTCHPSPSLTTFAFRSREVSRLLLDFDPYGGTDPLGMFSLFIKRTADVMAPPSSSNNDNNNNIIILLKEVSSARLRESDIHPISPKTPAPQYQP